MSHLHVVPGMMFSHCPPSLQPSLKKNPGELPSPVTGLAHAITRMKIESVKEEGSRQARRLQAGQEEGSPLDVSSNENIPGAHGRGSGGEIKQIPRKIGEKAETPYLTKCRRRGPGWVGGGTLTL